MSLPRMVELGSIEDIQGLLETKSDIEQRDDIGRTALHIAVKMGKVDVVKFLLLAKANPLAKVTNHGLTPLQFLTLRKAKNTEVIGIVRDLVEAKSDIDSTNDYGHTALHLAVVSGDLPLVQALLEMKASIQAKTHQEITPLILAAQKAHLAILTVLLEAELNIKDRFVFSLIIESEKWDVLKILIENHPEYLKRHHLVRLILCSIG